MKDLPSNQRQSNGSSKSGSPLLRHSILFLIIVLVVAASIAAFVIARRSNFRAAQQGVGYISVVSSPSGADMYINGDKIGATPISNYRLRAGSYSIAVKKDGYKDYTKEVEVKSGGSINIAANLSALTGTLSVSSTPKGAKVYINGEYKGLTPLTLTLKIGDYHIKIIKAGYTVSVLPHLIFYTKYHLVASLKLYTKSFRFIAVLFGIFEDRDFGLSFCLLSFCFLS